MHCVHHHVPLMMITEPRVGFAHLCTILSIYGHISFACSTLGLCRIASIECLTLYNRINVTSNKYTNTNMLTLLAFVTTMYMHNAHADGGWSSDTFFCFFCVWSTEPHFILNSNLMLNALLKRKVCVWAHFRCNHVRDVGRRHLVDSHIMNEMYNQ